MALTAALTAFTVWSAIRVGFDYNMLKLQAKSVESVAWEERILAKAGRSGFAALATASSLDELRKKQEAFAALPTVAKVESVLMLVPDRQPEKVKLIQQFAPLRGARARRDGDRRSTPAALRAPLETLRRRLQLITAEGSDKARREVQPILAKLDAVLDKLGRPESRQAGPALEQLQAADRARLRRQAHELPEERDPAAGRAGRCSPRDPASLCREERALSAPHPPGRRHLAAGGSRALRDGSPARGPRRHRPAHHELRGHPLHPARLLPGHACTHSCSWSS